MNPNDTAECDAMWRKPTSELACVQNFHSNAKHDDCRACITRLTRKTLFISVPCTCCAKRVVGRNATQGQEPNGRCGRYGAVGSRNANLYMAKLLPRRCRNDSKRRAYHK